MPDAAVSIARTAAAVAANASSSAQLGKFQILSACSTVFLIYSGPFLFFPQITSLDEARAIIEAMRLRYQCRGRQIMAYRKKLHQQVIFFSFLAFTPRINFYKRGESRFV
jgi:hypothetical protein